MSLRRAWRTIRHGLRALLRSRSADRDLDDEIRHFHDEVAAELEERGLSRPQAERAARLALGNPLSARETVRASGWEHMVSTCASDVRHGLRRLRRAPGFTMVAVTTLAIGVGASTAVFSALDPILLSPLPYRDADRVQAVLENGRAGLGTFGMYRALAQRCTAFEAIAVVRRWQPAWSGGSTPERFEGQRVSAAYFRTLGVTPAAGRDFTAEDDRPGAARVVIISDALWRRLGADPASVGRTIRLDDNPFEIAGVLPRGFENVLAPEAQVWTPLQYDPALPAGGREWGHHLVTVARLAPGVEPYAAGRDANGIARTLLAERKPETYDPSTQLSVAPLQDVLVQDVKPVLLAVAGAVLLVLILATVNVANLLLARGAHRQGEFALRAALGAGRTRLMRQLLTESLLLALAGGAAGVVLARVAVRGFLALGPAALPRAAAIHVDGSVLSFSVAVTIAVGIAFGLLPALEAAGRDPHRDMQVASHRTAGGQRGLRRALVVLEVALAFVLLIGAGLLLRSVSGLLAIPSGVDARSLLTMQVQLTGRRFDAADAGPRFFRDAIDAVRRVPGVSLAAASSQLPLSGDRDEYGAHFPAADGLPADTAGVFRYAVTPGYFAAAGIPILRGRPIDERDSSRAPLAAVISASLATARFGSRDPLGRTLRIGPAGPFTIVGVAGDVRQLSLAASDANAVYLNPEQSWFADRTMSVLVRTQGDPGPFAALVREAIWSVDKDQPIVRVATMSDVVTASAAERRFALAVFEAFALTALLLAAIGIYGILAGGVSERTREIGLRAALGATRAQIVALVIRQGLALTAAGILAGIAGAVLAGRSLATLLFGITALDPLTYVLVAALLAAVSFAACAVPAWRAVRVDPSQALRAD